VCSIAGAVYDVLRYVHPSLTVSHDGMKFSTPTVDYDTHSQINCASYYGGGWWYTACGAFAPTAMLIHTWYSLPDNHWYDMKNIHLMIKLQ